MEAAMDRALYRSKGSKYGGYQGEAYRTARKQARSQHEVDRIVARNLRGRNRTLR